MKAYRVLAACAAAMLTLITGVAATATATPGADGSGYVGAVLADHPYLYWRLGEATGGIAADSSGFGRDGAYVGTSKMAVPGLIAGDPDAAVHVYGGSGVTWTPNTESVTGSFTAEAWARLSATGQNRTIISSRRDGGSRSFDVKFSDQDGHGFRVDVGDSVDWLTTTTVPFAWHLHQTYLVDAAVGPHGVSVYVNGRLLSRISFNCQPGQCTEPLLTDPSDPLQAGFNFQHLERMRGTVDEVALYQSVLSAEQVAAHYAAGL